MYGRLIGTYQRSFKWYHPRPPMASPFSRLGVCNLATPLISVAGKATDFKFGAYTYRANSNIKKILRKWSVGISRDCPNFLGTPYYLGNG